MSAALQGLVIGWTAGLTIALPIVFFDLRGQLRYERARADRLYDIAFGYDRAAVPEGETT